MEKLEKIKGRILAAIQKEEARTRSEIEELSRKQHASMGAYGVGGPYQRYERAIGRRQDHLSELEALRKAQCAVTILETLRLYGYYCPSCRGGILKPWDVPSAAAGYTGTASIQNGAYRRTAGLPVHASMIYERTRRII